MTQAQDNWRHRSSGLRCRTCMWFVPKVREDDKDIGFGRCRRHAPGANGWVPVFATDFCGDHRLDENRIAIAE